MLAQKEVQSWLQNFVNLKALHRVAFNEKDRLWVEEEKKLFFNEIGMDEDSLMYISTHTAGLYLSCDLASTDEERESIRKEIRHFFNGVEDLIASVDKHNLEKKQKSIPPTA